MVLLAVVSLPRGDRRCPQFNAGTMLRGWNIPHRWIDLVPDIPVYVTGQFSKSPLVQNELKKKGVKDFDLAMRTKAEEDPVVAAASVVARAEFVRQMHLLSKKFGAKLQKGAGPLVKEQAHQIIEKFGVRALGDFAKLHFRTAYEVVQAAGKLDELPLPEPKEKIEWS